MSIFNFDFNGQKFEVQGPPGATEAQARAVFEKQASTGALVGLDPGSVLNAASQAVAGLTAAGGQVVQALTGAPGLANGSLGSPYSAAGKSFTASLNSGTSTVKDSLASISKTLGSTAVTNGIAIDDFAKQASALVPISGLSGIDVRAALAQASTIAGQGFTAVTDTVGVGKFGFDATQLETAGLLKTGTVATYLAGNINTLTNVLKSPAVWTGKNGINNLDNLLNNPSVQNLTQQDLMSSGLASIKQLGIPVDQLSAKTLGGLSLNAAKSAANTLQGIQNNLPANAQAQFDIALKDGAYAIGVAEQKLNDALTQTAPPGEAENTVNRQTVDAATTRVVGNDKVPSFDYGSQPADPVLVDENKALRKVIRALLERIIEVNASEAMPDQADAKSAQLGAIAKELNTVEARVTALKARALNATPYSASFIKKLEEEIADIISAINNISTLQKYLRQLKQQSQQNA
jgi:hypothetical protein